MILVRFTIEQARYIEVKTVVPDQKETFTTPRSIVILKCNAAEFRLMYFYKIFIVISYCLV